MGKFTALIRKQTKSLIENALKTGGTFPVLKSFESALSEQRGNLCRNSTFVRICKK